MEPHRLTATEALQLIQSNTLTVESYARALLSRIESRDPAVKAWVHLNPDAVLQQARLLDQIPVAQRGPLHGIPVAVKDVIYTKDMPTQHNSPLYKDSHVAVDAAVVASLRAAGALIFGKTTTTEFAAMVVGPATRNPHSISNSSATDSAGIRTPGGSSSGSAAAVADFQIPIALGTQTGGSTVRPGSFNGVYGFKPTWNAVSREGCKVYAITLDTVGYFARGVGDLRLLGRVLGVDDYGFDDKGRFKGLEGARIGVVKSPAWDSAGNGTVDALERGKVLLEKHGAVVEEVQLPAEFDKLPDWHVKIMAAEGRVNFLSEYRKDKTQIHPELSAAVENVSGLTRVKELEAFDGVAMLRPRIDEIANRYDALLTPSVPDEAPLGLGSTGSAVFNRIWTALHVPVVTVPGFGGENGMPIGLTLVAARYHDQHLLNVAEAVGKVFEEEGGWKSSL
ncbi:hypothetical protein ASPVEDRAFT_57829 [Aspergillus versicolor CBS 583.65]|uniref:Amidase domain-containing protein n=1 Tax=Aspergillus versicolor CBS 583.65 TaxID=1036611 RepID=A0A1L9Q556_ASPVE|nr:uncharacterized protein ASPVEDRAFT_57829 [Aspergillus versicolor CBS 583.65]OJJ08862.1 hypothetical protein ASPVEDRAFT_57829 [Aspergillus versicolor CBS 583.65]